MMSMGTLRPLVRWPDGLENDLEYILPYVPGGIEHFYDPFVGSGAMFFGVEAAGYYLNDTSEPLIETYRAAKKGCRSMWHTLESACHAWKSVEARIIGVQDVLLQLAYDYPRKWENRYAAFCMAVKDALEGIWFSDLFTFAIPDPADFCMELRHQVIGALVRASGKDVAEEDVVEEILTGMKAAVFYFMSEVYLNPAVDGGIRSAALVFISHYCKELAFFGDCGGFGMDGGYPEYMGAEGNRVYLGGILSLYGDVSFAEKMSHAHFWNVRPSHFLQKNAISEDDFLFMAPRTEAEGKAASDYIKSYRCNTRWMLVVKELSEARRALEGQGLQVMGLSPKGGRVMFRNY